MNQTGAGTTGQPGTGLLQRLPNPPGKVILLRASRIGDFLCAVPAFRALRSALPQAEITLLTLPMLKDLADRLPYFDRVILFPGYPGIAEQFFDPGRTARFFQEMQAERFDLAVQMQGSGVYSNPFMLMLGAGATAGFIRETDPPGRLDLAVHLPTQGHEIERVLALPKALGAPEQGVQVELPLYEEDNARAAALVGRLMPPLIGLHPAARDWTRRWKPERFAQAASELQRQYGGTIVILGEARERATARAIEAQIGGPVFIAAARTSLPVLAAVISQLSVLITNDTGPAHMAYALNTPCVTIFGGGDPTRYGPSQPGPFQVIAFPVDCRPCTYTECPIGTICLENVSPEEVVRAAGRVIRPMPSPQPE